MDSMGFPTLGKVFKTIIEALGITFRESSFLKSYYDENDNIDVGNLSRRVKKLEKENSAELPEIEELSDLIILPLIKTITDNFNFPMGLKKVLKKKINQELTFTTDIVLGLYKTIVINIGSNNFDIFTFFTTKVGLLTNLIRNMTYFKFLKSNNEIEDWLQNDIIKENYFSNVFEWWVKASGHKSLLDLSNTISKDDDTLYKLLRSWKNSKHLPELGQILQLVERLPEDSLEKENKNSRANLLLKLITARIFTYFYKKLSKIPDVHLTDLNNIYNEVAISNTELPLKELHRKLKTVYIDDKSYNISSMHSPNSDEDYLEILNDLNYARSCVYNYLQPEAKELAVEYYLKAFNNAKYRIGNGIILLLKEILIVAAFLENNKLSKRVYSWAKVYDLFDEPYSDVKNWVNWFYKMNFLTLFDIRGFGKLEAEQVWKFYEDINKHNIYDWNTFKLNRWRKEEVYANANLINSLDSYSYLSFTQLMRYCIAGSIEKVEIAIERGARIDICNEDNGTALFYALFFGRFDIALLLLRSGKKTLINNISYKDRFSYIDALLQGLTDENSCLATEILNELIKQEINLNLKTSTYDCTPVYSLLKLAFFNDQNYDYQNKSNSWKYKSVRDYDTVNSTESVLSSDCNSKYAHSMLEGFIETSNTRKILLKETYLDLLDIILEEDNLCFEQISKSKFTSLLYLSRVGTIEYFTKIHDKTEKKLYLIKGENLDQHESIIKNSALYSRWDILEFYLKNNDLLKIIESDYYLPCVVVHIFNKYIDDPKNIILRNILQLFGKYFLIVIGAILQMGRDMEPEETAIYINNMIKDMEGISEKISNKDFLSFIDSVCKKV